ncbi:bifunctional lysine ketoglutarate reductase /saccharopine dehydrogenase family protein [Gynuella sunshinyii]|uniref:Alanine dehydrogenase n=1 Tax=Gynuella sunshinyii YC6258 TaxID=1445510 RepID=A0A0C5VEG4_9GAMM|nr:bifunctional lysine ketoglutarate reductase /saccharopine dehydrogenase family protein [Gynuella sunshinyii]AJQ92947.1 alanine dehydrogenase [Gynuella sunshinyii YC6258]
MKNCFAIRAENPRIFEQRSPLTPDQVQTLIQNNGLKVIVESSDKRFFKDDEFRAAGAVVSTDTTDANLILGVKEIPIEDLPVDKACVFFSHTIKGQTYNMPLLQAVLDRRVTLIDYEKIADSQGRRLVFFGPFAGLAGAIDALWILGRRLQDEGIPNPFSQIRQALEYGSLQEAKSAVEAAGEWIRNNGLPETGKPWVIAVTGNGTVARGAGEIIDLLPVTHISAPEFKQLQAGNSFDLQRLYKVVIDCDHFVKPVDPDTQFEWQDYFQHPEKYQADFEGYLPDITLLINCIYWDVRYPKLVTCQDLKRLFADSKSSGLKVIADITCDIGGSIECNQRATSSANPCYVYNPETGETSDGVSGAGPVILAVDKLPTELPVEASAFFGQALMPWLPEMTQADYSQSFEALQLPAEIKKAVIAHHGSLTPDYQYLQGYLD